MTKIRKTSLCLFIIFLLFSFSAPIHVYAYLANDKINVIKIKKNQTVTIGKKHTVKYLGLVKAKDARAYLLNFDNSPTTHCSSKKISKPVIFSDPLITFEIKVTCLSDEEISFDLLSITETKCDKSKPMKTKKGIRVNEKKRK